MAQCQSLQSKGEHEGEDAGSEDMAEFSDWLLSIGDGRCGDGMVDIPTEMFTEADRLHSLTG